LNISDGSLGAGPATKRSGKSFQDQPSSLTYVAQNKTPHESLVYPTCPGMSSMRRSFHFDRSP
jgi:hypothetical protein